MIRTFFRPPPVSVIGFILLLAGCTSSGTDDSGNTTIASTTAAEQATTTSGTPATTATTPTTASATTTVPVQRIYVDFETGVFESVGYACNGDDTSDCGDSDYELTRIWMGGEVQGDDGNPVDFVDFFTPTPGFDGDIGLPENQIEIGLGVRVEPTTIRRGLVGESFIHLTFSGVSAERFGGTRDLRRTVVDDGWAKWVPVESGAYDPVAMPWPILTFPSGAVGNFITEMGLIESGENTMTWLVGLNYSGPSQYHFRCSEFGTGNSQDAGACQIRLAPAPED